MIVELDTEELKAVVGGAQAPAGPFLFLKILVKTIVLDIKELASGSVPANPVAAKRAVAAKKAAA